MLKPLASADARDVREGLGALLASLAPMTSPLPEGLSPPAVWERLARDGWTTLGLPGPESLDLVDLCWVAEEWGRHRLPVPLVPSLVVQRWAQDAAAAASPSTYLAPVDEQHALVPFGGYTPGIDTYTWAGTTLERCALPPGAVDQSSAGLPLLTVPAAAELPFAAYRDIAALSLAEATGTASEALDATVRYVSTREQFGRPIGSFQAVQHRCADMLRDTEISRSLVAAIVHAEEEPLIRAAARDGMARAARVVEGAVQLHGGVGFTWEVGFQRPLLHVSAHAKLVGLVSPRPAAVPP